MAFPLNEKLPPNNNGVSLFGQTSRNQREQELEYFINKHYNSYGIRLQTKLNAIDQQFQINNSNSNQHQNDSNNQQQQPHSSQTQLS
jgi:hypothetical protein